MRPGEAAVSGFSRPRDDADEQMLNKVRISDDVRFKLENPVKSYP